MLKKKSKKLYIEISELEPLLIAALESQCAILKLSIECIEQSKKKTDRVMKMLKAHTENVCLK